MTSSDNKPCIVVIHGAKPLRSKNKLLQKIIIFLYTKLFNFIPQYQQTNLWLQEAKKYQWDCTELKWNGMVPYFKSKQIYGQVTDILKNNPHQDYIFVTESIGTEIALLGIGKNNFKNVKGIIALCPVNKPRKIQNFQMISIKSKYDKFERFSNKLLWPLHFFHYNRGSFKSIELEGIRHDQFVPNQQLGTETLSDLVFKKIKTIC